ncbi:MAG TPA: PAS domain-containing protein [Spirochaetia bacterium]|nr:PAS domain-containing protein [Spirochaetia bacterium]
MTTERSHDNPVSVLVVEDSPTQAEYLRFVLERDNNSVTVAQNGQIALSMLSDHAVDIVLSDIVMPQMDGYELCRRIRQDERLRRLPVILITVLTDAKDIIRALEAGADNLIRKPIDEQSLLSRIRQVMMNRRLRAQASPGAGVPIYFDEQTYVLSSDRTQALDLLLSTYEAAVEQNRELTRARDALRQLNENLEIRVYERTISLGAEVEKRKNAERMLETERNLLRTVLDAIPDSICLKDASLRFITGNAAFLHSLRADSEKQIAGKSDHDFLTQDLADRQRSNDRKVMLSGLPDEVQERRKPNDHTVDLRIVRVPVRNELGEVAGVVVIHWDITDLKHTEERLERERTQLRTLVDNIPDLIYFKDSGLRFVLSNAAHLQFLGLSSESEIVGKRSEDFYPPELAQDFREREIELLRQESSIVEYEEEAVDHNGDSHVIATTRVPIFDASGAPQGLVGIGRDVTEDRELRRRLEDLAKFPNEDPNPVLRVSREGGILFANTSSEPLLSDGRFSSNGTLADSPRRLVAAAMTDGRNRNFEGEYGGRIFRFVLAPIVGREYVNIYGFDETEKKILEDRLVQASKMEAIGRLAGGIAHDFNNMMAVIKGFSEYLIEKLDDVPQLQSIAFKIKEAEEKAAALTTQLLAFSRKRDVEPHEMDLNETIAKLESMLRRVMSQDILLSVTTDSRLWPIVADVSQIDQVILNLVINARDAMPSGGNIEVATRNVTLDSSYAYELFEILPGDYVSLSVRDSGTGMDSETRARIFEPFFTTKGEGIGTGLGLAVVYGVVRDLKGDIRVSSSTGTGTMFQVYFPRAGGHKVIA